MSRCRHGQGRVLPLCACLCLAVPCVGQVVSPGYSQLPGVTQSTQSILRGTVINASSGEPIPRALVQVNGYPAQAVLTDSEGRFEFQAPAGRISIAARKPGFFGINETNPGSSRPQLVRVGPNTQPVVIKLLPAGVITGHVEDDNGEPVERAQIRVTSTVIVSGRKQRQPRSGTATNEDGDFRVGNLPAGPYYVSVAPNQSSDPPLTEGGQGPAMGYPEQVYSPGVSDYASAAPIALAPGQRAQVDFSLTREPVFRVSGTVAGYQPGQFPRVELIAAEDAPRFVRFDPRSGSFESRGVPRGNYRLRAIWQDNRGMLTGEMSLVVAADVSGVRLVLQPGTAIPINIRSEFNKPFSQQAMSARPDVPLAFVVLNPLSPFQAGFRSSVEGPPESRTLAVRNMLPGKYAVEIQPSDGGWYPVSVDCGDIDLLREPLVVAAGTPSPPIEIVLRDDGARLAVSMQAEEHDQMALLMINSSTPMASPKISYGAGQNKMSLSGLAPGDYTVYAFDNLGGIEYTNPEVMKKYADKAAHVTLAAGGQASVTVDMIKTGE